MTGTPRGGTRLAAFLALAFSAACSEPLDRLAEQASYGPPGPEERIAYFRARVAEDPLHWPALAHLGAAYLDRARETHDVADVLAARARLERSLEVQPNYEALRARSALENFCHRFADALVWADRAAAAAVSPDEAASLRVEAYLGLGRVEDAARVLQRAGPDDRSFHLLSARAQLHVARGEVDDAARTLERAARVAEDAGRLDLQLWALVRAGGVLLDAGRSDDAEPFLDRAATMRRDDRFLGIHRAELHEARGDSLRALSIYEELLRERPSPALHARAFSLARALGRDDVAEAHFRAAEAGYRAVLEAGEIFTLAGLAELYLDAGRSLAEASALAERNLEFERDAASLELARRARERARAVE